MTILALFLCMGSSECVTGEVMIKFGDIEPYKLKILAVMFAVA